MMFCVADAQLGSMAAVPEADEQEDDDDDDTRTLLGYSEGNLTDMIANGEVLVMDDPNVGLPDPNQAWVMQPDVYDGDTQVYEPWDSFTASQYDTEDGLWPNSDHTDTDSTVSVIHGPQSP